MFSEIPFVSWQEWIPTLSHVSSSAARSHSIGFQLLSSKTRNTPYHTGSYLDKGVFATTFFENV